MPVEEKFALANQSRRSVYSIPMNIAEGCGKTSDKDFVNYLDNALGSAHELEYSCFWIYDLNFIGKEQFNAINNSINEVKAMLVSFIKYTRNEK